MIQLLSHIILSAILLLPAAAMTVHMHFWEGKICDLALIDPVSSMMAAENLELTGIATEIEEKLERPIAS